MRSKKLYFEGFYYRPVVVKLSVETYALALLFAFIFILKITKLLALALLKLQPVDSFPFMPAVCHTVCTPVDTVVSVPQAVTADPVLLSSS